MEVRCLTSHWHRGITHALEEFQLTYGPYPAGFSGEVHREEKFPDLAGALAKKAASALAARGLKSREVFLKYGKPEHMAMLLEDGRLRVQPASEYSKPDHNGAVRDDELALEVTLYLTQNTIRNVVINPQDVVDDLEGNGSTFASRASTTFGFTACPHRSSRASSLTSMPRLA